MQKLHFQVHVSLLVKILFGLLSVIGEVDNKKSDNWTKAY